MWIEVEGRGVYAATGGREHQPGAPLIVFLHGAGMDHTVWALQSRWFAYHGYNVAAVDLPGHGQSDGPLKTEVDALGDWTAAAVEALGGKARLVGHSLGALIALNTSARHASSVEALALIGVAAKMPVHPDLLAAAKAARHEAIDRVAIWGLGAAATRGGSPAPGLWMLGGAERLLERAPPGALYADLNACNAYKAAEDDATAIFCPTRLVLGERDQMTPLKSGLALARLIAGATAAMVPDAGHMLPVERPDETLAALKGL